MMETRNLNAPSELSRSKTLEHFWKKHCLVPPLSVHVQGVQCGNMNGMISLINGVKEG
jgi:hypothetical protein